MSALVQDLRVGLRLLRQQSAFNAITILALTLGIVIFSVVDARPIGRLGLRVTLGSRVAALTRLMGWFACYIPARRAIDLSLLGALRYE
jgi:hypothetical protein